jgi:hypothetical protein
MDAFTSASADGMPYIMEAELLLHRREVLSETAFAERVLWLLPRTLPGSTHRFKYRLALVVNGECVLRYDNEAGKGDHRHIHGRQEPYEFAGIDRLLADFRSDVEGLMR